MPTPVADHAAKEAATLARIEAALVSVTGDIAALKARIAVLEGGNPPPPPPPPPPGDDAAILAKYTDSSVAGMNARLGPAGDPTVVFPTVWQRPEVVTSDMGWEGGSSALGTYSKGLFVMAAPTPVTVPPTPRPNFDFGGDELGFAMASNRPLVVNPSNPAAINSDGIPPDKPGPQGVNVGRLRLEEHTQGMVRMLPAIPWNDPDVIPDRIAVTGHTASFGMGNKLGQCIDFRRGRINRYDGGFGLYDKSRGGMAYIGTMPTNTAWSPWAGEQLDPNYIPLCLGVSSQNEFLFVGVHDESTRTGKLVVIVNWGGQTVDGKTFPFDFITPHPGLLQSGVVTGMKILGTVDLPIKWPTSISIATSRNTSSDRIEGPDGNAAYLRAWNFTTNSWGDTFDLTTQVGRDLFLAKNGGWVSTWGKIVVASKEEGKVVQLDATALYQGYRDQYFTTQAKNDATLPQNPTGAWYEIYKTQDQSLWPYMLPAWVPTVTRVIDVIRPTVAWMLETNDGAFVIGTEAGILYWYNDAGVLDPNALQLGANITSIKDDKYIGGGRGGAMVVTSRVARTVYGVDGKQVKWTLQDSRILDPVDAGDSDTHGIEGRLPWVLDFNGKKVLSYRNTMLRMGTQGGGIFGTGPTAEADKVAYEAAVAKGEIPNPPVENLEHTGSYALPDSPFSGADSNVN